ncbi:MAG: zinc ribbon domain-containing protein [Ardenticatenaceae bacterium]
MVRCGICGLNYTGVHHVRTRTTWYRCNGKAPQRGKIEGKCPSKAFKGEQLEPLVWCDIERFLRNPGDILEELQREREMDEGAAAAEAERMTLEEALRRITQERKTAIHLRTRSQITDEELGELLAEITHRHESIERRLKKLIQTEEEEPMPVDEDMLAEIRRRLDAGLTEAQRQEIVRLLVKRITVYTDTVDEERRARLVIEYRFPMCVVEVCTGTGSWR